MDLIEQLGGYERAKRVEKNVYGTGSRLIRYPSKDFDYNDDGGNVCDVELISFKANDLKKSLLEYRRANNIFEVGDKVVFSNKCALNHSIWQVIKNDGNIVVAPICNHNGRVVVESNTPVQHPYSIQHTTDAEIAAGHRL